MSATPVNPPPFTPSNALVERVRVAIEAVPRSFFARRRLDGTTWEVIHDLDPTGPLADETLRIMLEGTEDECVLTASFLQARAVARAAAAAVTEREEWRPDRPGWYWVRRYPWSAPRPYEWVVDRNQSGFWRGIASGDDPAVVGRAIPLPVDAVDVAPREATDV